MRRFYLITRDLHLYVGLFLSPFVLVFSVSVFYLVHGLAQRPAPVPSASSRTVNNVAVPAGLAGMQGRAALTRSERYSTRWASAAKSTSFDICPVSIG